MSDVELAEGIYVKKSKGKFGIGATSRESIMETYWFPRDAGDGFVNLFPVSDDLKRVLKIEERVDVETFNTEFSLKEDSRDVYLELKNMVK